LHDELNALRDQIPFVPILPMPSVSYSFAVNNTAAGTVTIPVPVEAVLARVCVSSANKVVFVDPSRSAPPVGTVGVVTEIGMPVTNGLGGDLTFYVNNIGSLTIVGGDATTIIGGVSFWCGVN
jgi:hypothetical protein